MAAIKKPNTFGALENACNREMGRNGCVQMDVNTRPD